MHSALRAQDLTRVLSNAVNALQLLAVPAAGGLWRGRVRRGRAVQLPVRAVCPWDTEPRPGVRVVPTQHVFQCKPDDELRRLRRAEDRPVPVRRGPDLLPRVPRWRGDV